MKFRLIVIALFFVFTANAQKVKVSGVVSDPGGIPIESAVVQVKGTMNGTVTNEKGAYSLSIAKNDSVTLVFSFLGYSRVEQQIENPQSDLILNIRMRPQSYELEGVTITRSRIQTNTMEKISAGQGRLSVDATGGSIESLLATAGIGVASNNELSIQYSVRGGNYDENMVYVNGIEVYRPLLIRSGQQEGLSFINPDMTESVQFSSGGFDARYGDKMSSVLDITYKKPEKWGGGVMASMLGGSTYVESATGKFTQITGLRYKRGTTLLSTLDTKGDYNPSAMDIQSFMTYDFSSKLHLNFLGNYSENTYDFNPQTRRTSYGTADEIKNFDVYYDGRERDRFRTLSGAFTLKYDLAEHADLALQFSGFQSLEEETYDITGEYWMSNVVGEEMENIGTGLFHQHARNHLNVNVWNASVVGNLGINQHSIRWALSGQKEKIKDRINEWELRDSMNYSLPYNDDLLQVLSNLHSRNDIASNRFSGYIQDTYKWKTNKGFFYLTAGIRGSYWDYNQELILSPRVSLGFVPERNPHLTFRLASGMYYQSPFYKEFRIVETDDEGNSHILLNKDIRSQRSIHWVAGGDYTFKAMDRPFKFTAEMYYKKMDRLVPYTIDNVRIWYYGRNSSHGYASGIDFKLFGQLVEGTDSWLNFSLMEAKQYIDGKKVSMPTDQLYNFTLYFTDHFPKYERLQLNLRMIWIQGLPFSIPGNDYQPLFRAPSYRRVDMGLSYLLWGEEDHYRKTSFWANFKNIWVGIDIFNLLNIKNVNSYSWFTDITGSRNAVPNRLTGRQFNFKLIAEF
ncbi:MAG: TonB-dependent receptor [Candidatus Azobacteroides sp.]|nr:TonB-dependent receptor [Candidatus Azobacteroides sp.]